jgi:hypothetical protein
MQLLGMPAALSRSVVALAVDHLPPLSKEPGGWHTMALFAQPTAHMAIGYDGDVVTDQFSHLLGICCRSRWDYIRAVHDTLRQSPVGLSARHGMSDTLPQRH